jgi:hypothetical protein
MDVGMRFTRYVLFLAFPLLLAGCGGSAIEGTPSNLTEFRTLASMTPFITASLTARTAQEQFGTPNAKSTAGEIVLVYAVENSETVNLGFPNPDGPILFARLIQKDGTSTNLTILP